MPIKKAGQKNKPARHTAPKVPDPSHHATPKGVPSKVAMEHGVVQPPNQYPRHDAATRADLTRMAVGDADALDDKDVKKLHDVHERTHLHAKFDFDEAGIGEVAFKGGRTTMHDLQDFVLKLQMALHRRFAPIKGEVEHEPGDQP